jgi:hypothetical protein
MFKKSAILLAVSSLAMAAQADVLSAGKDTKFEVNVDVGAFYTTIDNGSAAKTKDFKGASLNQIEIKASHKVSDEISVFGEIEVDYDPITDNGTLSTDDMRIGLASKSFGRISAGQFDNFFEDNVLESLIINRGDKAAVAELSAGAQKGRTVQYTHKLGDLSFGLDYSFTRNQATAGDAATDLSNSTAVTLAYKLGDLTLAAGMANFGDYTDKGVTQTVDSTTGFSLNYAFGATKLAGLYAVTEDTAAAGGKKTKHTGAAITTTVGQFGAGLAYQVVDKDGADKRNEMSVSLGYKPYKGFELFLDLSKLDDVKGKGDRMEVGAKYSF